MKFVFLLMITMPAYGALSPVTVKDSALKYHPKILAAIERVKAGEHAVVGARGAFDTKVVSDYKRQTKSSFAFGKPDYQTTLSRTQLEKPLGFANSKVYVGAEQISNPAGFLSPIYHTGNPTTQTGNYTLLGAKVSLWKHFTLDPDRAAMKNAQLESKIATGEKQLTVLDIGRLSQLAYWEWVTATKVKIIYDALVKNGETRNEYLMARSKKGDIAQIVVTENEQYIARRKGALQAAKERLLHSEYALALFNRDQNGDPVVPGDSEDYEDYPINLGLLLENLALNSNIDEIMEKRPDLRNLALNVDKMEVNLELAKQDLRPRLDITGEYFKRTVDHRPEMPLDYIMVLASITVPIERNLGNGNIAAARARQMVARKQMSYGQQSYKFEVTALRKSLQLQLEQVRQSEIEFLRTQELVKAENMKFKTGGGNLFLVNIREEAQASAEASFHESRLAFMNTLLTYQALVKTGE
jgi:outer membrane protein TolC